MSDKSNDGIGLFWLIFTCFVAVILLNISGNLSRIANHFDPRHMDESITLPIRSEMQSDLKTFMRGDGK